MIQLNLLPDVKLEYIHAQRQRRLVISIALLVTAVSLALLALLLAANALQKKHINDLSRDINTSSQKLKSQPQIGRILTVQNQLGSLTALHDGKPAVPRLFDFLNQVTPSAVSLSTLTADFTGQTMTITGSADALSSVNRYVDTLKFTNYKAEEGSDTKAFNNVVLTSFSLSSGGSGGQPASYTITMAYDKTIFDTTRAVKLTVPNLVTTRSEVERPSDLFQAAPAPANAGGGGR
jgi:hypothetical protein